PMIAPRGGAAWMKWAALAGGLATVGLTVAVIMLLTRKPTVIVVPPAPVIESQHKLDDKPITVADDVPPPQNPTTPGADKRAPKRTSSARSAAVAQKSPPTAPTQTGGDLSNSQRNLASLYRDEGGEHGAKGSPTLDNGAHGGSQVSQQAIMAVPTQNRRSLSLCYDRVLKHDSTLKSGRILIHVKIGISGSVTGVAVPDPQYSGSEIGQCLVQTIKHWHFPSADSEYETEFPIILQAN
ncbi:MAG TPA: AgmX/PglI C-terminal domain-containing protein, partial [Polyangia bacterium]|nr:AgmX/PglI C-terminal domain-containing protein [Polyangia bacterium]